MCGTLCLYLRAEQCDVFVRVKCTKVFLSMRDEKKPEHYEPDGCGESEPTSDENSDADKASLWPPLASFSHSDTYKQTY